MCLITEQKTPLIAQEDMTVYKILTSCLKSTVVGFQYKKEKLFQRVIRRSKDWTTWDDVSANHLDINFLNWRYGKLKDLKCIGSGFHSFITKDRIGTVESHEQICKCTVPKGSEYYLDATGLCVSNKIIIH